LTEKETENLRKRADEKVRLKEQLTLEKIKSFSSEQIMEVLHDLTVHQIELEMQNEELRTTQISLDTARARYFDLYELAPVGYMTISEKGLIQECNLTASTLLGINRIEITMQPLSYFIIKSNQDMYYLHFQELLKTLVPTSFQLQMKRKDGTVLWVRIMMSAFMSESDEKICRIALSDISELKKADSDREKLNNQLIQMQKLESLGLIAGGIAHDFNNLLSGVFNNIELAIAKNKEEKVATYLSNSIGSIDRARSLTQKLLTFAKGGTPVKKVVNLFPFIQETVLFALSGSTVMSKFHIQEQLWSCNADKTQIGQVFNNLTINAQQAMVNGGMIEVSACNISLSVKEHQSLAAGNYVKISMRDHGIGISKKILPNIFDPYYTTDSNGHGLGLSICYSIVKRHGGYISAESEMGKGSTFSVYLPASIESILTIPEDQTERDVFEHVGTGTFLLMDDEESIRLGTGGILEEFGYRVVLKENGKDAVDFFKEETKAHRKLAGMIFDLTIPGGMGGKEAIREIRKICSDTPAFVASGYSADPVMANPEEYGFNGSLCKPFSMSELSEMLEKHIKKLK